MYTNQLVLPPGTPTPYPETVMEETPGYEVTDYSEVSDESNASAGYFYDSLAPYGNWIDVSGYGLCWQPTVVVINPNWQPYCDRGHWVYSDCGWYWSSGYSWGWAPFHYGRWFCHSQWGWCWAPDTVWGPSWVTWRYSPGYCGWAPLPPTACYTPGIGISHNRRVVSTSFDFGLRADRFTFVAANRVLDTHLERHRLSLRGSRQIFNDSVVFNRITEGRNNTVVNEGIPIRHVAAATHSEIRRVHIREATDPANTRSEYIERDGTRSVAAFRPKLPQPTRSTVLVGESVRPAPRPAAAIRIGRTTRSEDNARRQQLTEANLNARDPGVEPSSTRDAGTPASSGRTSSIILRGPDRSMNPNAERAAAPPGSVILAGPRNANRASTPMVSATPTAPSMPAASSMPTTYPAQETSPVHYNPYNPPQVVVNPNQRQLFNLPTRQAPSPGQNQRANAGNDQRYPQYRQPEARAYTPPAPVVQVPQAQPVYQPPRAVEPPQQYRQANPAPQPQAPQPVVRSQPAPRSESRPAQPRQVESRPSPPPQPQQPAPQVRSDSGSSRPAPGTQSGGGGGAGGGRRNR